jgi:XRE family transcriptional regulator of biofilm formation
MLDRYDENYVYYLVSINIKRIRKEKGLTQEELANIANYSKQFISNIESKNLQTFSLGTLWRLAIVLNVDIKEFFYEEKKDSN